MEAEIRRRHVRGGMMKELLDIANDKTIREVYGNENHELVYVNTGELFERDLANERFLYISKGKGLKGAVIHNTKTRRTVRYIGHGKENATKKDDL